MAYKPSVCIFNSVFRLALAVKLMPWLYAFALVL